MERTGVVMGSAPSSSSARGALPPSRDCIKESKLTLGCEDALLGEGEGGLGAVLANSRSLSLRLLLSFLFCLRWRSITISIESYCLAGMPLSNTSDLIGVMGGVQSRKEEELFLEMERAMEEDVLEDLNLEGKSELDRDRWRASRSTTREGVVCSGLRNRRIWSLRLLRSSRVIPRVKRSWEMGETWGSAIARHGLGRDWEGG
jgi:hypothetical protein